MLERFLQLRRHGTSAGRNPAAGVTTFLAFGFVAHAQIALVQGRWRSVRPIMWAIAVLSGLDIALVAF